MTIDINKTYRTRSGKEVILHTTEAPDGLYHVVGSVFVEGTSWAVNCWDAEGLYYAAQEGDDLDLVEVRDPLRVWFRKVGGLPVLPRTTDRQVAEGWPDAWETIELLEVRR